VVEEEGEREVKTVEVENVLGRSTRNVWHGQARFSFTTKKDLRPSAPFKRNWNPPSMYCSTFI
jgi:hypothetical protein